MRKEKIDINEWNQEEEEVDNGKKKKEKEVKNNFKKFNVPARLGSMRSFMSSSRLSPDDEAAAAAAAAGAPFKRELSWRWMKEG